MLKNQIAQFIPSHIREKYPLFVRFMELYYEWCEQSGRPYERLSNHLDYLDFIVEDEDFIDMMRLEVMPQIPKSVTADRKRLILHIKDLYQKKGTEDSIKFILRILFGAEDTEVYYPRKDILILSDDGRLSSEKKLQDSYFYQIFSYVIRSSIDPAEYREIIEDVVHPAGTLVFYEQT